MMELSTAKDLVETKKQALNDHSDLVSIVITTKNEEQNIQNCLLSIKSQTYPKNKIEIIVVDNDSTDETKKIARNFTELIFNKGPERSAQRNLGILSAASGQYAMFLDADMILSPCLIENCVHFIKKNNCIALYIPEIILGTSYGCRIRRFERSFYNGTVIDAARFFKKNTFEQLGGFDETLSGPEDWDFDKKLRSLGNIGLVDGQPNKKTIPEGWHQAKFISPLGVDPSKFGPVIYHNESNFNLNQYLEKKAYYSQDMDKYIEKWGNKDPDIRKQLGMWYRFFGVFFEKGKWKTLLGKPHLALGMYGLRFLVGVVFFSRKITQKALSH